MWTMTGIWICSCATGGKLYLNKTNLTNAPAHENSPSGPKAEHYLDVLISGANQKGTIKTKDGIGTRITLFKFKDKDPNSYSNGDSLIGIREIDGGSGYGSQASQVQHFS